MDEDDVYRFEDGAKEIMREMTEVGRTLITSASPLYHILHHSCSNLSHDFEGYNLYDIELHCVIFRIVGRFDNGSFEMLRMYMIHR